MSLYDAARRRLREPPALDDMRTRRRQAAAIALRMARRRVGGEPINMVAHPRTQAINDEFGWDDAHDMRHGRSYDPWTGEDIEP